MRAHALAAPLAAAAVIVAAYALAREPAVSESRTNELASAYRFERFTLPNVPASAWAHAPRGVRPVNAALHRIRSWISAVGAAVALGDLRGEGVSRDVCYVDPRTDSLIVAPVPGTPRRYAPFVLRAPARAGIDPATVAPMGCVIADFDEDGASDVLAYYWGRSPVLFLRHGGGRLDPSRFVAHELVPSVPRWYTNAVLATSLAGTTHADLIVGNYFRDGARVLDPSASDGCEMQASMSRGRNGAGLHVFRWTRGGYREEPDAFGPDVAGGWTLALSAAPLTESMLPDVYVANDFGPDHLLRNLSTPDAIRFRALGGVRGFTTPRSSVLGTDSFKGMGAEFTDLLGRGEFDLFVSNITEPYALEESNFAWLNTGDANAPANGRAPFANGAERLGLARSGWAWDAKVADFDNSGRPVVVQAVGFLDGAVNRWPELQELAMGNDEMLCEARHWPRFEPGDALSGGESLKFYVTPQRGARYVDVAPALGLTAGAVGRGIAVADTSASGRLDFASANQWGDSYFYRNAGPRPGASLELRVAYALGALAAPLVDPPHAPPARAALGSTVRVESVLGTTLAVVDASSGHSGRREPLVHVGLGRDASGPVGTEIRWHTSSGSHRLSLPLAPGRHLVVLPPS